MRIGSTVYLKEAFDIKASMVVKEITRLFPIIPKLFERQRTQVQTTF